MKHLGTYKGYDVVEQENERGHKFLTTVNVETRQWDELVLFQCYTFEEAKVAIDQHLAYDAQMSEMEPEQEINEEALEAVLRHIDEMRGR